MYYLVNTPDGSQVVFQADKKQVKELMQPIKVSRFQGLVLDYMAEGHTLKNHFTGDGMPYRPAEGMSSGTIHIDGYRAGRDDSRLNVPWNTIKALLKEGLIKETHRINLQGYYGSTPITSQDVYYELTDLAHKLYTLAKTLEATNRR
jgi:hypothetical protein